MFDIKWVKLPHNVKTVDDIAQTYELHQFVREHLESNPIESIVDTEDPQFNSVGN